MNEEVFLVFALLAAAFVGVCLTVVRSFEDEVLWFRFRFSTVVWVGLTTMVAAGLINMSDSWPILCGWVLASCFFAQRAFLSTSLALWQKVVWALLAMLPVSGWILFFSRFPHLHGMEASAGEATRQPS